MPRTNPLLSRTALYTSLATGLAAGPSLIAPAAAQEAGDQAQARSGVNEIIVTAQRREESVQDVPIAISAFNEAELEVRGVTNALEVTQFVPNLVGINNTGLGTANAYYLRGIGNTESIATFDPPIGTYIDDIYISRQNANNLSFFDVERVEVLRGPQGTLFGRNTTGGAVNVFLAEPEFELGGFAEVGYGSFERKMARASLDVPLADTFAIKLSGYWQDDDGYTRNTTNGERLNENDGWGVRLGLRGELSDSVRWTGSYIHTYADALNLLNFDCDPRGPATPGGQTNCDGRFATTGLSKNGNFDRANGTPQLTGRKNDFGLGNEAIFDFVSSNFEIALGENWSVNLITGYVHLTQKFALDFADGRGLPAIATPVPAVAGYTYGGFTIVNDGSHSQFTQEVKVNGTLADGLIDLVGGLYYFQESNTTDFADLFTLPFAPPPTGLPLVLADRTITNDAEAWAGYLQADLNLTEQIKLTAGIRYTDEDKTFSIRDNRAACNAGPPGPTCLVDDNMFVTVGGNRVAIPRSQNASLWTPRFAVNYQPNDDLLFFASATRGFKSGGWAARGTTANELLPFGPETAWSYEAGAKTTLFDNRLRFNLTGFWLDISDLQTPSAFIRANGSLAFITRNFADYRNKGVEVEITAAPVEGLNLFAAIGYQDDEYRIDRSAPALDEFGVQSVAAQQAACLAELAAGNLPGGPAGATDPRRFDTAQSCGVGIVAPDGSIATPVRTPDWTVALGGSFEAQLGGGLTLTPAVNANWRSKSQVGTSQVTLYDGDVTGPVTGIVYPGNITGIGRRIDPPTGSFSDSRWIVNASLTLAGDDGWALVAECKNCFDEEAVESSLANYSYLNPPRTWMVRAKYDF